MPFNYKKLLMAYINHVGTVEGSNFLGNGNPWVEPMHWLTLEETNELIRLSEEVDDRYNDKEINE